MEGAFLFVHAFNRRRLAVLGGVELHGEAMRPKLHPPEAPENLAGNQYILSMLRFWGD